MESRVRLIFVAAAAVLCLGALGSDPASGQAVLSQPATGGGSVAAVADCPVETFPSVSRDPANSRWPAPLLEITCTADQVVVTGNGIPGYAFKRTTPSDLREQSYEWRFPRQPELADDSTSIPLLGAVAIAVNGLPIYGPNEGEFPDPYGDPVYVGILDDCLGHTARRGDYHYHALLLACLTSGVAPEAASPVIGWSFDGFAIYGPRGCADGACTEVVEYVSGWQRSGDPTTYAWDKHDYVESADLNVLDQCNGHTGPQGDYHYHATSGFPYVLGCYSGYVDPSALGPSRGPDRGRRRGPRTIRE
ncbi:MAG: YHYH protein [Acidobacteria bacterium]|nr:YHYH protein [Acidobacteriota bacterium]